MNGEEEFEVRKIHGTGRKKNTATVTLPKKYCEICEIKIGDKVMVFRDEGVIRIEKL